MYSLPYLSDIREKIDKKIEEDPDFYDNVRVNGLRKDIVDLLKDMRKWVDKKDQNQIFIDAQLRYTDNLASFLNKKGNHLRSTTREKIKNNN